MALKNTGELLTDVRNENRNQSGNFKSNGTGTGAVKTAEPVAASDTAKTASTASAENSDTEVKKDSAPAADTAKAAADGSAAQQSAGPDPVLDTEQDEEFKKKFEEYFKGSAISGTVAVDMVDGLKAQFLWIYAKKCKVDLPQDAFRMDPKSRELAIFLADYAIKNKLLDIIKKNPLITAVGILGISAGTSYLMIEMLKKGNNEASEAKAEADRLRAELKEYQDRERQKRHEGAQVVETVG
jgi:hypothetical protein